MLLSLLRRHLSRQTLIVLYNFFTLVHKKIRAFFSFFTMSQSADLPTDSVDHDPFDPSEPSTPISYPIKTLEELASRAYFDSFHYPFNKSSVPLSPTSVSLPDRPRLLVCHDMQGGYGDDKWVQGGTNPDAYAILHWYLIDVFVYFSHYLVTLPPPCWTNTAHRHGVKVLGTFITEWKEGRLICDELLATLESARMYAERLAELAVSLGFDGWLINIENELSVSQIPIVQEFISHLTQTMHFSVPGSLVIWYDSVITDGNLKWQDQLNENNKPFFDVCDGIFVNYTWKENYPKLSAVAAGDRRFDVYMGIDVFGRKTYGGGEWNTSVALDVIKKDNVSAAIFAPGWVYETKQPPDFSTAQNRWWSLVEKSWGRVNRYPKLLPFYSNFDQGRGYEVSFLGADLTNEPWNNLSCQGIQPFLEFVDDSSSHPIQALVDLKEASYNGGGNITFKGTLEDEAYFSTKIFQGELIVGNLPLHISYSVKSEGDSLLGISLQFSSTLNEKTLVVLVAPWETKQAPSRFSSLTMPRQIRNPKMASGWLIHEGVVSVDGYTLTEIHAVCYRPKPERIELRSEYEADGQDALVTSPAKYHAVLGHITVKSSGVNTYLPPPSSWLVEGQHIKFSSDSQGSKTLSMKLIWKRIDGNDSQVHNYNLYVEKIVKQPADGNPVGKQASTLEYLGVALIEAFYVSNVPIPPDTKILRFIIQTCAADGTSLELDDCPCFELDV